MNLILTAIDLKIVQYVSIYVHIRNEVMSEKLYIYDNIFL